MGQAVPERGEKMASDSFQSLPDTPERGGESQLDSSLPDTQQLLERVFDAIPDLLSVVDRNLRIHMSNWHGGYDYVAEERRRGKPFCYDAYYPEQGGKCRPCHLDEVFRTGRPVTVEKFNPRIGEVEIRAFPVVDDQQRVVLAAEYIRDISSRKAAERALQEREQQLRRITDNMLDLVSEADPDGIFRYISPSHRAVLGFAPEELLGTSLYELFHPDDLAFMQPLFQKTLPWRKSVRAEFRYRHAAGHYLWLETVGKVVHDAQGRVSGAVYASRDISERRHAEEGRRQVNQTLTATIEASPLAIFVLDADGCVKLWNVAAERMFGWRADEVLGRPYPLAPGAMEGEFRSHLAAMNRGETFVGKQTRRRHKDGRILEVSFFTAPLRSPGGTVAGTVGIICDITEVKRAERALRDSEANYRAIFDAANDAIFVLDIDTGAILDVNSKLCQMYGYSREEILRLPIEAVSSGRLPFIQENALTWIHSAVDGASRLFEWHARKKCGELFWVEVNMKGAMIGGHFRALAVVRDITERKRAEAALRESEERFHQVFEQNEDPAFLILPGSMAIFDSNIAASQLYGYSNQSFREGGLALIMDADTLADFARQIFAEQSGGFGKGGWSHIVPIVTIDKQGRSILASFRGRMLQPHKQAYLYGTFRDVTEKLRIRKERSEMQAKLFQANKLAAIGNLAAGIAHEVNNPNNYILANAQLLDGIWADVNRIVKDCEEDYRDFALGGLPFNEAIDRVPQMLSGISEGARRIRNIVASLKDFARQDEAAQSRPLDVNRVIAESLTILASNIRQHTDHFFCNLHESLPRIAGHFQRIEQVVINLVLNALQALPDRNSGVYVSTTFNPHSRMVELTIRDQGCGIPLEIRSRILEPFFSTRQQEGGTGLGLSICYAIVEEHHGRLEFESQLGQGTTVTVSLPIAEEARKGNP
ncbi:MAG TPA: hypothetical protein DDY20_00380 [Desulfobulbaceae bacterium]|nr:hypothetical protein [Desulfobulbaceae bacterium]